MNSVDSAQNQTATPGLGKLLRKRRLALKLTLQILCDQAGLSVGYLSLVERDKAVPTLATLAQIAEALDVDLSYFINTHKPADAYSPAQGRKRFFLADSSVVYEAICSDYSGSDMSSFIIHVPAGFESESVGHEGEEIVFILEGTIEHILGGDSFHMAIGDSLHFDGATPHSWANRTSKSARILWTGTSNVFHRSDKKNMLSLVTAKKNK